LDTNLPPNPAEAVADLKRFFSLMRVLHALASRGDGLDVPLDEATAQLATSFRTALLRRFVETRCAGAGITLDLESLIELFDELEALEGEPIPAGMRDHSRALRGALVERVAQHPGQAPLARRLARGLPPAAPVPPARPAAPPAPPASRPAAVAPQPVKAAPPPPRPAQPAPTRPAAPQPGPRIEGDAILFGTPAAPPIPLQAAVEAALTAEAPPDPPPPASATPPLTGQGEAEAKPAAPTLETASKD
jgi:hypothetical protein